MSNNKLHPDPHLQVQDHGQILIGGSPTTVMRLSARGAQMARGWFAGETVSQTQAATDLAGRMVEAGMAHPVPDGSPVDFAVVIPVRDDAEGLAATQACLAQASELSVIVVEDSAAVALGPAAARNLGAEDCEADVLIFIDAGVQVDVETLGQLANHLSSEAVVAVAPRVMSEPGSGTIAAYEQTHSPLDLGRSPGQVAPGRRISYVPSTVLGVRNDAFRAGGGFDPQLRYGEDVDLIWRLGKIGRVRYDPSLTATHPPRKNLRSFARQRYNYGTSAGPLAGRHGSAVAPVVMSPWSIVTLALVLAPLPRTLVLWLSATTVMLSRRLPGSAPLANAVNITLRGHYATGQSVAAASTRAWWPLSVMAAMTPLRSRVGVLAVWSWLRHRTALGLIDDLAYGAGLWRGTLRARSARSVLPRFSNQSKRSSS